MNTKFNGDAHLRHKKVPEIYVDFQAPAKKPSETKNIVAVDHLDEKPLDIKPGGEKKEAADQEGSRYKMLGENKSWQLRTEMINSLFESKKPNESVAVDKTIILGKSDSARTTKSARFSGNVALAHRITSELKTDKQQRRNENSPNVKLMPPQKVKTSPETSQLQTNFAAIRKFLGRESKRSRKSKRSKKIKSEKDLKKKSKSKRSEKIRNTMKRRSSSKRHNDDDSTATVGYELQIVDDGSSTSTESSRFGDSSRFGLPIRLDESTCSVLKSKLRSDSREESTRRSSKRKLRFQLLKTLFQPKVLNSELCPRVAAVVLSWLMLTGVALTLIWNTSDWLNPIKRILWGGRFSKGDEFCYIETIFAISKEDCCFEKNMLIESENVD